MAQYTQKKYQLTLTEIELGTVLRGVSYTMYDYPENDDPAQTLEAERHNAKVEKLLKKIKKQAGVEWVV